MSATKTPVQRARRSLGWLTAIILLLVGVNLAGVLFANGSWTPKLALDLEGGTQIILTARITEGQTISHDDMQQAVEIIRQRVDSTGAGETEIAIQGERNIVISIPGQVDQETMNRLEASAVLEFRQILQWEPGTEVKTASEESPLSSPDADITDEQYQAFMAYNCAEANSKQAADTPADKQMIACDSSKTSKFLLSEVRVSGSNLVDAYAGMQTTSKGASLGQWAVTMEFTSAGSTQIADLTRELFAETGKRNMFGIVLDGEVISYPTTKGVITDGRPQISGSFTQKEAKQLADQLKFGALPISFDLQATDTVSATLGKESLVIGLITGLVGLILVLIYSLFQYRTLGFVTFASLIVAAIITYLVVTIMSWRQGYRLSLAGITGLILAVGITADSFIVYFERIRDELRDGKNLVSGVEQGWKRAFRTVFASDTVNFLAAAVLYVLAAANVQGFALTLGLTTIIDLVVVALFTHPILQLLANTKFFGNGHPWSGLDPKALGAVYRGRLQFKEPVQVSSAKIASSSKEAKKRQSIAERKAQGLLTKEDQK